MTHTTPRFMRFLVLLILFIGTLSNVSGWENKVWETVAAKSTPPKGSRHAASFYLTNNNQVHMWNPRTRVNVSLNPDWKHLITDLNIKIDKHGQVSSMSLALVVGERYWGVATRTPSGSVDYSAMTDGQLKSWKENPTNKTFTILSERLLTNSFDPSVDYDPLAVRQKRDELAKAPPPSEKSLRIDKSDVAQSKKESEEKSKAEGKSGNKGPKSDPKKLASDDHLAGQKGQSTKGSRTTAGTTSTTATEAAGGTARSAQDSSSGVKSSKDLAETGREFTIGGGLNLTMKWIKSGTFQMGSETGVSVEKPVRRVTLTQGYWLGKTEITQAQWEAVMGNNPSYFTGSDRPVEQVSWDEVMRFCQKVNERERAAGRLPAGYVYTLPTEAQWEFACRAGTTGDYAGNLDAMAWYSANSGSATHPVGQKQANAWGLHDMHGNVWEWCLDGYGSYPGGNVVDPTGASSGTNRVFRGCSCFDAARYARSAVRNWSVPGNRHYSLGFRVALSFSP